VLRRSCLTSFSACYGLGVQESETCQPLHHGSPVQSEQSIHPISCAMRPLTCMQTCGHDTDRTFDRRKRDWMRDCRACSGSEVGQRLGRRCLKIPPNPQSTAIQSHMSITRSMHIHTGIGFTCVIVVVIVLNYVAWSVIRACRCGVSNQYDVHALHTLLLLTHKVRIDGMTGNDWCASSSLLSSINVCNRLKPSRFDTYLHCEQQQTATE
jgi:hypothetical protein